MVECFDFFQSFSNCSHSLDDVVEAREEEEVYEEEEEEEEKNSSPALEMKLEMDVKGVVDDIVEDDAE